MLAALFLICTLQDGLLEEDHLQDAEEDQFSQFQDWKSQMKKHFASQDEEDYRFRVFQANSQIIKSHNAQKGITYTMALNQFADLTQEEFQAIYATGFIDDNKDDQTDDRKPKRDFILHKHHQRNEKKNYDPLKGSEFLNLQQGLPDEFDSRSRGWIGPVKNQGSCGSCWAFSAVSSIEAGLAVKGYGGYDLSEQYLVDCAKHGGDGCQGGRVEKAYEYISQNKGVPQESQYPYTGVFGRCMNYIDGVNVKETIFPTSTLESIKMAIMRFGSINTAVDCNPWRFYGGGIFRSNNYGSPNHAVNIVGWGKQQGQEYFIIRNSWSKEFGEDGYIRVDVALGGIDFKEIWAVELPF